MAKINTTNYQPVTSWNGTQDLLIVEQPDGTKVATPEQVKQYVEAGDFEATGEIKDGHGNILAKKADITTVTIPAFTPSEAGWRRICKIKPTSVNTIEGVIHVGGEWSNGQPPSASVAVNTMYSSASLTLLSSCLRGGTIMTAIRLISPNSSGSTYWLDVYFQASSVRQGAFKLKFTGDIAVSDIQDPISITTDATAATAEVSLNQNVRGTVLTNNAINYFDIGLSASSIGHEAPKGSAGGVYYEPLVSFAALNITKDKVLNIIPVGWNYIAKPFTLYMSVDGSHVGAIIDSDTSIYASSGNLTIRVVYKDY